MQTFIDHALVSAYGVPALCHLLNSKDTAIIERFGESATHLPEPAERAIAYLQEIEDALPASIADEDIGPSLVRFRILSGHIDGQETTRSNLIRSAAGGTQPIIDSTDVLEQALIELAWQTYPLQLMVDASPPHHLAGSLVDWGSPVRRRFENALYQDSDLQALFAESEEYGDHRGFCYTSTGRGGSTQVFGFADRILNSAWKLAHFRMARPSAEVFMSASRELLCTLRSAIRGEDSFIPVRIGLAGVVPPAQMISTNWGWAQVRPTDERDERFAGQTPFGGEEDRLSYSNPDGSNVEIHYSGDLVAELYLPYRVKAAKTPQGGSHSVNPFSDWQSISEVVDNIRLSLLLTGTAEGITVVSTWTALVDPLGHDRLSIDSWKDPRTGAGLLPTQLDQEQLDEWGTWAARVADMRTKGVGVAIRRILRAVGERQHPEDVLVDSVIVWENLFGAAQETTLRVTTAIAWLLGKSPEERLELHKHYKKIYTQRSSIVHGSEKIRHELTANYASDALQVSIDLLRVIFRDRPDLLSLKDAAERSIAALLQIPEKSKRDTTALEDSGA